MISEIPWPFLIDTYDVALAAELWRQGRFDKPYVSQFHRQSRPGLILTEMMAGKSEVDEFLTSVVYTSEVVETLSRLPILRDAPSEFLGYIQGGAFTGNFWSKEDGAAIPNLTPYAGLEGFVGHVVLYQRGVRVIFDHLISRATEARDLTEGIPARVRIIDGGSQRSFGHGWSLWDAYAARIAGRRPYPIHYIQGIFDLDK
jgi:nicotinic acid phosphoribosyltransferase